MTISGLQDVQLEDRELVSMLTRITSAAPEVAMRDHRAVLKMTDEVFPAATISVEESVDPEIENWEHIVISVMAKGSVYELVSADGEWHKRLRSVAPETARHYCLSLSVA